MLRELKKSVVQFMGLLAVAAVCEIQAQQSSPPAAPPLFGSPLERALAAYSAATGRTMLHGAALPALAGFESLPADPNAVAGFVAEKLREQGFALIPDGRAFALVVPVNGWTNSAAARFISALPQPSSAVPEITKGAIVFNGMPLDPCIAIYAEFQNRAVLRPTFLPPVLISLSNAQALSRSELDHAFSVLFALNGIAAVDDGEKFVQLLPLSMLPTIVTNAPQPTAHAVLLNPKDMPKTQTSISRRVVASFDALGSTMEIYAELKQQSFVPPKDFDGQRPVMFRMNRPLTKEELTYAVETVLRLNGWVIAPAGEGKFTLNRLGAKPSGKGGAPAP